MGDISEYDTPSSSSVSPPADVKAGTTDAASKPGAHPIDEYSSPTDASTKAGTEAKVEAKPPPDYANMSGWDVAKGTAKAFVPDAASIVPEVVGGIGSAIKHTYDTKELPGKGLIEGTDAWINQEAFGLRA